MTLPDAPTLRWMADTLGLPLPGADRPCGRFVIDSRLVRPGDVFVALKGSRQDGHDYVAAAAAAGAVAALVARPVGPELPQFVVPDPLTALQRLATAWRAAYPHPVVGITGSNGKTTTKHLAAAVLSERGPVLYTEGNLNNHLGVPLTLMRLRPTHVTAVIEMGANHIGDIAGLCRYARPDLALVTQAADAHLEGFGSRDGVAQGKGEIYDALPEQGIAIVNVDDPYAPGWRARAADRRQLGFGLSAGADVRAETLEVDATCSRFELVTPAGRARVRLLLVGAHNVMNALAAAAVGHALGLAPEAIARRLGEPLEVPGRLRLLTGLGGACVADDSYNANPTSMRAGLDWLARQPGRRWAVLGHMAELGPEAYALHRELGAYAAERRIDRLIAVGAAARGIAEGFGSGAERAVDIDDAVARLGRPGPDITVLVKGSRSAGMDAVVRALTTGTDEEAA